MDDSTLASLEAAFAASPDNGPLLALLLKARLERGDARGAFELLAGRKPSVFAEARDRAVAAQACLAAGAPEQALEFAAGEAAELRLMQARALVALGKLGEASAAYAEAVRANPTLEDVELARLVATAAPPPVDLALARERPRLRVVANDATDGEEVERLLLPALRPMTFADVGGLDDIKEQVRKRIILPFQKPSLFARFKKRVGGGILLYGPPGCGKTLLARATAGECGAAFYNVAISDVLDMYIGESERKLHAVFERARSTVPAVLFFDELEALAGKRQYNREAMSAKLVSQFLAEMDGFAQNNRGVLIIGATNVPWAVDPAFRRPGRFDRVLFVPPPDARARAAILEILIEGRPHAEVDREKLARMTNGFSGADLDGLVDAASDAAIARSLASGDEAPLTQSDLVTALREVKPSTQEWLTTARNYARYANEGGQYDEVLEFLRRHGGEP